MTGLQWFFTIGGAVLWLQAYLWHWKVSLTLTLAAIITGAASLFVGLSHFLPYFGG